MLEEYSWMKRIGNWIYEKIEELIDEHGVKNFCIGFVLICIAMCMVINVFISLWNLEVDVDVVPIFGFEEVVEEDIEISVMRTAKMSENVSITSLVTDSLSALNSEIEAVSLFTELVEACDNSSKKQEIIFVPKNAGRVCMGEIEIYAWARTGRYWLSDKEFSENYMIMFLGEQYIKVYMGGTKMIGFEVGVEMGTY